jgi:hypothetical protein
VIRRPFALAPLVLLACAGAPPRPVVDVPSEVKIGVATPPPATVRPPRLPLNGYRLLTAALTRGAPPELLAVDTSATSWGARSADATGDRAAPLGDGRFAAIIAGRRAIIGTDGAVLLDAAPAGERFVDVAAEAKTPGAGEFSGNGVAKEGALLYSSRQTGVGDDHRGTHVYFAPTADAPLLPVELPESFDDVDAVNVRYSEFSARHVLVKVSPDGAGWLLDRRTRAVAHSSAVRIATGPTGLTVAALETGEVVTIGDDGRREPFRAKGHDVGDFRAVDGRLIFGGPDSLYPFERDCGPNAGTPVPTLFTVAEDGATTPLADAEYGPLCEALQPALVRQDPTAYSRATETPLTDDLDPSEDGFPLANGTRITTEFPNIYRWRTGDRVGQMLAVGAAWGNGCSALPVAFARAGGDPLGVCTDASYRFQLVEFSGASAGPKVATKVLAKVPFAPADGFDGTLLYPGECGSGGGETAKKACVGGRDPSGKATWKAVPFARPWKDFLETSETRRVAYDAQSDGTLVALFQQSSAFVPRKGARPASAGPEVGSLRLLDLKTGKERLFPRTPTTAFSTLSFAAEALEGGVGLRVLYNSSRLVTPPPTTREEAIAQIGAANSGAPGESSFVEYTFTGDVREVPVGPYWVASFDRNVARGRGDVLEESHDFGRTWSKIPAPPGGISRPFECNGVGCTFGFFFRPWSP